MTNDEIKQLWQMVGNNWSSFKKEYKKKITQQELYDIVNDITPDHKLAPCGKLKEFKRFDRGYQFCSNNCKCSSEQRLEKAKQTNIMKYGHENAMQNPELRSRFTETMVSRYGQENALQVKQFKDKASETFKQEHGVDSWWDVPEMRSKHQNTLLINYGVEHPAQHPEIREQMEQTMVERHGGKHSLSSPSLKEKIQETISQKYGRNHHTQIHITQDALNTLNDPSNLEILVNSNSLTGASDILGIHPSTLLNYWNKHGLSPFPKSSYEKELHTFLIEHDIKFISNTRKILNGPELDIYILDHNVGIEFNGLYWHSSNIVSDDYHRQKYEACRNKQIKLVMIYEDEWILRKDAWKNRILNILNKSSIGKGARKLSMRTIDTSLAKSFCSINHIQGATGSLSFNVGAYDEERLVGVMCFNHQRKTMKTELIRYCTDGASYAGLFSRMLKYAINMKGYDEIISFADLRHSDGDVYRKNGFILEKEIRPDYRYVYRGLSYHKSHFTKTNIQKKFPNLDMTILSEREAMVLLNIPRIYDCGKLKYVMRPRL